MPFHVPLLRAASVLMLIAVSLANAAAAERSTVAIQIMKKIAKPAPAQAPSKPGWTLVFDDEFDSNSLVSPASPWSTGYPFGQTLSGELEYYTRYDKNFGTSCDKGGTNHIFAGGTLTLRAKSEPGNYEMWHWDQNNNFYTTCEHYNYTSAMLWSNQQYRYGYFEIRAKIPNTGKVMWPAFWLYGEDAGGYREIDVFEFGGASPNRVGMNVHLTRSLDDGVVAPPGNTGPRNHYPASFDITYAPDVSTGFHTYAVKWTPSSIVWYVDGQPVRTLAGHSPHLAMHVLLDLAVAPWDPPNGLSFPQDFEIDYVRVYKSEQKEFIWDWGNQGNGKLAVWNLGSADRYVTGDFDGSGRDELLAINPNGFHHTMKFGSNGWQYVEGAGNGKIDVWNIGAADSYVAGDFEGNGKRELLAINPNGWHHTIKFYAGNWHFAEGGGNAKIDLWNINSGDRYVAGDFDGDGKTELLAINPNGWHHTMRFYGGSWHFAEGSGNGKIGVWNINPGDSYVVGDFDGDGKDELLAINPNGWHHTMKFSNNGWHFAEGGGNGKINWWDIGAGDRYVAGRFGGNGRDQLLAISSTGWSHLMDFTGSGWSTSWGNDGANSIDLWRMHPADRYIAGNFNPPAGVQLLSVFPGNGWAHTMAYTTSY